jgi:hypothetical protein
MVFVPDIHSDTLYKSIRMSIRIPRFRLQLYLLLAGTVGEELPLRSTTALCPE